MMSYVYDATTDRSDVVILAAQDFTGDPVATIHLPVRVPFGFHGSWVPDRLIDRPAAGDAHPDCAGDRLHRTAMRGRSSGSSPVRVPWSSPAPARPDHRSWVR